MLPAGAKEKLSKEVEELKQCKEELEVRMNALKSQYEGRLLRLDRELKELRETQAHSEPREEPQDQSGAKVWHNSLYLEATDYWLSHQITPNVLRKFVFHVVIIWTPIYREIYLFFSSLKI